jgi:hypothetical protein
VQRAAAEDRDKIINSSIDSTLGFFVDTIPTIKKFSLVSSLVRLNGGSFPYNATVAAVFHALDMPPSVMAFRSTDAPANNATKRRTAETTVITVKPSCVSNAHASQGSCECGRFSDAAAAQLLGMRGWGDAQPSVV